MIALLRQAGWDRPIYLHGALRPCATSTRAHGVELGELRPATAGAKGEARQELAGQIVIAPPGAIADRWARRLPDPVVCLASGWMRVKQRAKAARRRAAAGDLRPRRLGRAAGDPATRSGAPEVWVTHGREEALVHAAAQRGIRARALALVGYEEEGEG